MMIPGGKPTDRWGEDHLVILNTRVADAILSDHPPLLVLLANHTGKPCVFLPINLDPDCQNDTIHKRLADQGRQVTCVACESHDL